MLVLLLQLTCERVQVEVIELVNDGTGLGFGIIGGKSTGVVVKTILPSAVADNVSAPPPPSLPPLIFNYYYLDKFILMLYCRMADYKVMTTFYKSEM